MRNTLASVCVATLSLACLAAAGCSDEEDGLRRDAASAPVGGSQDAAVDIVATDAPLVPDGATDVARGDVRLSDANADTMAASLHVVYATFNGTLVRIDPETAAAAPVGKVRNKANEAQLYTDLVMHWSGAGDTALAVLDYANPQLGTVDLCTGLVTVGPPLTRAASPNLVVEGLALHPNGTWFVSAGNPANKQSPISTNVGTLNTATGLITNLGAAVASAQDDADGLFFRGETLFGFDVATTNNRMDLFTINASSGANTIVITATYAANMVPLRVAFDVSRNKAFSWRAGDRHLLEISLSENLVRPIGPTHAANLYANQPPRGFFVAPAPACP